MNMRKIFAGVGLLLLIVLLPVSLPAKQATVTLEISGMTWGSCASAVQSALQDVKGVEEVRVSLENKEAVVKYDSDVVTVDDLIKAVKNARGMNSYDAKVKKKWCSLRGSIPARKFIFPLAEFVAWPKKPSWWSCPAGWGSRAFSAATECA
jgi:periplasmic mercuric ion binding protein